jgi:trigger factor
MDIPGATDALADPEIRAKAEEESERLLDELKKSIKVKVKDIGKLRKELAITVPQKIIGDFLSHNIDELREDAQVPGFRKGHAPRQLVVKRFGPEVRDSLKTLVLGQSYYAAIENEKLEVLGDPLIRVSTDDETKLMGPDEALPHLKLPDSDDFDYVCELEVKPEFELPELKGIALKKPNISVSDEDVENVILNQRKVRGRFEPRTDGATADVDDLIVADVTLMSDGKEIKKEENVQLGVRPQRLDGIRVDDLGDDLKGKKVGETVVSKCTISDDYERADLRGKEGEFHILIHEIKRLEPVTMEAFVEQGGYDSEDELRQYVREQMEAELDSQIRSAYKNQIVDFLLNETKIELPEQLSARQTDRAIMRQVLELQKQGVPVSDIEARIDDLRTHAQSEAATALRVQFVLEKVAEDLDVNVTDEEVNTAIAMIARRYNRRFDRVRDDLHGQGLLTQLADQIRQDKCLDLLLADASISEEPEEEKAAAKKAGSKKPKAKKTTRKKKSTKKAEKE